MYPVAQHRDHFPGLEEAGSQRVVVPEWGIRRDSWRQEAVAGRMRGCSGKYWGAALLEDEGMGFQEVRVPPARLTHVCPPGLLCLC